MARLVERYEQQIRVKMSEVVGETRVDLGGTREEETNIGNCIADAMREKTGADVAFLNSGSIRINLPKGKITMEQVFTLLPFDNVLVTITMTGETLMALLEENGRLEKGLLQQSGMKIEYDLARPQGQRLVRALLAGKTIDPLKSYCVTINDFLAAGGDNYRSFTRGKNPVYGDNVRDVFVEYLRRNSPIEPRVEERTVLQR